MGVNIDTSFIKGTGRDGDNFLILLDVERILKLRRQSGLGGNAVDRLGGWRGEKGQISVVAASP